MILVLSKMILILAWFIENDSHYHLPLTMILIFILT
jgi:hypothetical protein